MPKCNLHFPPHLPSPPQALEDTFTTCSGREVTLRIYTQAHNADKTAFAMQSLKNSMRWDEERFGLEYDLSLFNIVAVDDFNMGAMENKSLNVFNSSLVLASPETATDGDYASIEGVIGCGSGCCSGSGSKDPRHFSQALPRAGSHVVIAT
jgi:aminopeptidase N